MIERLAPEDMPRYDLDKPDSASAQPEDYPSSPSDDLVRLFRAMEKLKIPAAELARKIDENGDGELSPTELHDGLLKHLNFLMSDREMTVLMKALDQV